MFHIIVKILSAIAKPCLKNWARHTSFVLFGARKKVQLDGLFLRKSSCVTWSVYRCSLDGSIKIYTPVQGACHGKDQSCRWLSNPSIFVFGWSFGWPQHVFILVREAFQGTEGKISFLPSQKYQSSKHWHNIWVETRRGCPTHREKKCWHGIGSNRCRKMFEFPMVCGHTCYTTSRIIQV